jgi:hypothetical protein
MMMRKFGLNSTLWKVNTAPTEVENWGHPVLDETSLAKPPRNTNPNSVALSLLSTARRVITLGAKAKGEKSNPYELCEFKCLVAPFPVPVPILG